MKIEKIAYEQLYPTGVYANQRYRAEATIEKGEDVTECYKMLQDVVSKTFEKLNPQINWNESPYGSINVYAPDAKSTDETKPRDTVDNIIEDIRSCKEIKVLESYKLIAKTNHRIQDAYDNKLKNLKHEHA